MIDSCKNCANFEERRDLEGVALYTNNRGPSVSCAQFEPIDQTLDVKTVDYGFCVKCSNFEEIDGKPLCANWNYPGIAYEMLSRNSQRIEKSNGLN
jgi:hypothetical protein